MTGDKEAKEIVKLLCMGNSGNSQVGERKRAKGKIIIQCSRLPATQVVEMAEGLLGMEISKMSFYVAGILAIYKSLLLPILWKCLLPTETLCPQPCFVLGVRLILFNGT